MRAGQQRKEVVGSEFDACSILQDMHVGVVPLGSHVRFAVVLSLDNPGSTVVPSLENSDDDLEYSGDQRTNDDAYERQISEPMAPEPRPCCTTVPPPITPAVNGWA